MSTAVRVVGKEAWVTLDKAKAFLGKQDKSIERLVKAGHLRTQRESREGRKPEKMYHAGDLDRIKSEAIPASAVPASTARVSLGAPSTAVASAIETALAKPIELNLSSGKPVEVALASNAVDSLESLLMKWLARDERISVREKSWLTWEEAVALSGIPIRALRALCEEGKIKALKFGQSWRVLRTSLQEFEG